MPEIGRPSFDIISRSNSTPNTLSEGISSLSSRAKPRSIESSMTVDALLDQPIPKTTLFCPPENFAFYELANSRVNRVELLPESTRKRLLFPLIESSTT